MRRVTHDGNGTGEEAARELSRYKEDGHPGDATKLTQGFFIDPSLFGLVTVTAISMPLADGLIVTSLVRDIVI